MSSAPIPEKKQNRNHILVRIEGTYNCINFFNYSDDVFFAVVGDIHWGLVSIDLNSDSVNSTLSEIIFQNI